jgi:hypothetical protein
MFKKLSLAVAAMFLMAGSVMANDLITADDLGSDSVTIASDAVGSSSAIAGGDVASVDDSATEAVEACFRGWGGCGYNYGCYNYGCYNHCYRPCYNYCYTPVCYNYCYRPVCYTYTCYQPCFYNAYWGCY